MTTIVDVAKKAGVSVSTVSYALNGTRPISEETRQRVLRVVEELQYHPNRLARGLASNRTRVIALLYPAISRDYLDDLQLEFIASISNMAAHSRYSLLLITTPLDDQDIVHFMKDGLADGVILMEVQRNDSRVALLQEFGYPFSLIGHCETNDGISFVDMDFYNALNMCVRHLADLKHREIAFITPWIEHLADQHNYLIESARGFDDGVRERNMSGVVHRCEPSVQGGYESMKYLLEEHPGLSAVIAGNEPMYSGITQALREKNLALPRDFSVIGIMSQRSADKYVPQVTTLSIPSAEMGRMGASFLIQKLEGQETGPQQVILAPQLLVHQSTARYRKRIS